MLDIWLSGFLGLLEPTALSFLILGMFVGLAFGAIPGLGGTTALALLIPMTYGMEPFAALALAGIVPRWSSSRWRPSAKALAYS